MKFGMLLREAYSYEDIDFEYDVSLNDKPTGGLWLSQVAENVDDESDWVLFCRNYMPDVCEGYYYIVDVDMRRVSEFSEVPTVSEIEDVLAIELVDGLMYTGYGRPWDLPSLWLKDADPILSMRYVGEYVRGTLSQYV